MPPGAQHVCCWRLPMRNTMPWRLGRPDQRHFYFDQDHDHVEASYRH